MNSFWNFPATSGGLINSINNAGIETFRGNELDSLTREICQNSLDALKDETKPVIIEFKSFDIPSEMFPQQTELVEVYKKCERTWTGKNDKSEQFIKQAQQIMEQPEIQFLRISDFNTKGLEGARRGELGSPWSSLIREAGSSNKGDSSGGSFGIGKSAPFANSKLRTLFYESLDSTNYKSHIGVANIMSFEKEPGLTTIGSGYYTNDENSKAIPGFLNLDPNYERTETGTDIYIAGFKPKPNWVNEIRNSVLFNFFITIHQKKLVVRIEDEVISHENLGELIQSLDETKEEYRHVKSYYEVLISNKSLKTPSPKREYKTIGTFEEGEATLYIMKGDDLNRRVLMTRKVGMRLFEQNRISGSISFTGILIITGRHMNQVFKKMENPAHTLWEPNRYEPSPKEAERAFSDLRKFVRETVQQTFQVETTDTMDAIGLSDFLPDSPILGEGEEKRESLTVKIKELKQKKKAKQKKKTMKRTGGESFLDELVSAGLSTEGDESGHSPEIKGDGTGQGGGSGNNNGQQGSVDEGTGTEKEGKEKKEKNRPIEIETRYICLDKEEGLYRINVKPKKKFDRGRLEFKVLGEQGEFKLPVKDIESSQIDNITISGNMVRFKNKVGKKDIFVMVKVDYEHYCVLEVDLYEV
ncbi:hypothetical protein QT711_08725 [Sporosarcina saromensis]|uniref:MACPF domain-containing protein n=1 Tax=Sporosarcina saromensis TaxID=359365 RepID=A0ABU4G8H3_9BACL|nr:hypothetical protein [Sporosarcina saromensis]MDW0113271.1 hypothetical protein [Sporosarcina saromensis]